MTMIRDIAYGIVKKMKAAYSHDGCDWQRLIEDGLAVALAAETKRADEGWQAVSEATKDAVLARKPLYDRIERLEAALKKRGCEHADHRGNGCFGCGTHKHDPCATCAALKAGM